VATIAAKNGLYDLMLCHGSLFVYFFIYIFYEYYVYGKILRLLVWKIYEPLHVTIYLQCRAYLQILPILFCFLPSYLPHFI